MKSKLVNSANLMLKSYYEFDYIRDVIHLHFITHKATIFFYAARYTRGELIKTD